MTPASHRARNEFAALSAKSCPRPQQTAIETATDGGESPSRTPPAGCPAPPGSAKAKGDLERAQSPKAAPTGSPLPSTRTLARYEPARGMLRLGPACGLALVPGEPAGPVLEIEYLLLALDPHVLHPLLYVLAFVRAALLALLQPGRRVHHLHGWDGNATALSGQRIWGKGVKTGRRKPTPAPSAAGHRQRWASGAWSCAEPPWHHRAIPARTAHGGKPRQGRGHRLHVPKEPSPGSALASSETSQHLPTATAATQTGSRGQTPGDGGQGGASAPGQGGTAKREEKRRRQAEADSRWKRRQWEYRAFY